MTLDVGVSFVAQTLKTGLILLMLPRNFDQRRVPDLLSEFVAAANAGDLEGGNHGYFSVTKHSAKAIGERPTVNRRLQWSAAS
ncbi:MAG TPA: hypothetical protein VGR43_05255 [Dehalococcoidia bacterium]|jgi:hypothetical protein|nr:hypothetical protein [Dehalococcoidia bacterium]